MTCSKISSLDSVLAAMATTERQIAAEPVDRYQQRIFTRLKDLILPIAFTGKNKRGGVA
jgi:hypothetical protein